jgi:hypothetical protein
MLFDESYYDSSKSHESLAFVNDPVKNEKKEEAGQVKDAREWDASKLDLK